MEYHRTQKRSTCVPAGHVHCKNCDKSIIVPMSYAEGATEILCHDCKRIIMATPVNKERR